MEDNISSHQLTELQYEPLSKKGETLRLYIYNKDGYHSGGKWFRNGVRKDDEEIIYGDAVKQTYDAFWKGQEICITNGGNMLVFHAKDKKVIYPEGTLTAFWAKVEREE
jgi:hypothetical protein